VLDLAEHHFEMALSADELNCNRLVLKNVQSFGGVSLRRGELGDLFILGLTVKATGGQAAFDADDLSVRGDFLAGGLVPEGHFAECSKVF